MRWLLAAVIGLWAASACRAGEPYSNVPTSRYGYGYPYFGPYTNVFPFGGRIGDHWFNGQSLYGNPLGEVGPTPGYFSYHVGQYKGVLPYATSLFPQKRIRRRFGRFFGAPVSSYPSEPRH